MFYFIFLLPVFSILRSEVGKLSRALVFVIITNYSRTDTADTFLPLSEVERSIL